MKMRQIVETRIDVCCEILYPRHEEEFVPNLNADVRTLWECSYQYVRDAIRSGAHWAMVELWDTDEFGEKHLFRVDARNPHYFTSAELLTVTH